MMKLSFPRLISECYIAPHSVQAQGCSPVRCFRDATLNLESQGKPTMWTVVVGDNGDGKTTLLRSIAMGLCDESSAAGLLRELGGGFVREGMEHASIKVHLTSKENLHYEIITTIESLPAFERVTQEAFEVKGENRTEMDQACFPWKKIFVSGYGAGRETEGTVNFRKYVAVDAVYTLFRYEEPLQNPEIAFRRLVENARTQAGKDPKKRENRAEETLERLAGLLKGVLNLESNGRVILASEGIEVEGPWGRAALGSVGDGYQSTITWVLDLFAWKMLSRGSLDPKKMSGIVLIDEIEQHLHPTWQRTIIRLLSEHFPRVQFIATTHSPLCASGAADVPRERAQLVLARRNANGIAELAALATLGGWRYDQVLTSDAFGMAMARGMAAEEVIAPLRKLYLKTKRTQTEERKLRRLLSELRKMSPSAAEDEHQRETQEDLRRSMDEISKLMANRRSGRG